MPSGWFLSFMGFEAMLGYSSRSVFLCVLSLILVPLCTVTGAETQPNVVVVFIDDMGWADFSCLGTLMRKRQQ